MQSIIKVNTAEILGNLRHQDGKLAQGRQWKSKTGMSPVVPAKNKILKRVVFSCTTAKPIFFASQQ